MKHPYFRSISLLLVAGGVITSISVAFGPNTPSSAVAGSFIAGFAVGAGMLLFVFDGYLRWIHGEMRKVRADHHRLIKASRARGKQLRELVRRAGNNER